MFFPAFSKSVSVKARGTIQQEAGGLCITRCNILRVAQLLSIMQVKCVEGIWEAPILTVESPYRTSTCAVVVSKSSSTCWWMFYAFSTWTRGFLGYPPVPPSYASHPALLRVSSMEHRGRGHCHRFIAIFWAQPFPQASQMVPWYKHHHAQTSTHFRGKQQCTVRKIKEG